jgi:hypothetical protein
MSYSAVFLLNEGLEPGVRVSVDAPSGGTATVCSVEPGAAFADVRMDQTGEHVRVASWRLDRLT